MNTLQSNEPTTGPTALWQRFQIWRAKRMLNRIPLLHDKAKTLMAEAQRLIRENSIPPAGPLFDAADRDRR